MSNGSNIVSFEDVKRASRRRSASYKNNQQKVASKAAAKSSTRSKAPAKASASVRNSPAKGAPARQKPPASTKASARAKAPASTKASARAKTAASTKASARAKTAVSAGAPSKKNPQKILLRVGAIVACLAIFCAAIYGPAQQCYYQLRERDRLSAEYAAVLERNDTLTSNVETLQSEQGIEDAARNSFGYVASDEESGSVIGLDLEEESTFTAKILSGSVSAPDTWYSGVFDWVFGYEG